MKHTIKKYSLFFIVLVVLIFLADYLRIYYSPNINIKNLHSVEEEVCYVTLTVQNQTHQQVVVVPNDILFYFLRWNYRKWFPNHFIYIYKVGRAIDQNKPIELDSTAFDAMLKYHSVCFDLVDKLPKNFADDTGLWVRSELRDQFNYDLENAVIYKCLANGINYCYCPLCEHTQGYQIP